MMLERSRVVARRIHLGLRTTTLLMSLPALLVGTLLSAFSIGVAEGVSSPIFSDAIATGTALQSR